MIGAVRGGEGQVINMASHCAIDEVIHPMGCQRCIVAGIDSAPSRTRCDGKSYLRVGTW